MAVLVVEVKGSEIQVLEERPHREILVEVLALVTLVAVMRASLPAAAAEVLGVLVRMPQARVLAEQVAMVKLIR